MRMVCTVQQGWEISAHPFTCFYVLITDEKINNMIFPIVNWGSQEKISSNCLKEQKGVIKHERLLQKKDNLRIFFHVFFVLE